MIPNPSTDPCAFAAYCCDIETRLFLLLDHAEDAPRADLMRAMQHVEDLRFRALLSHQS